MKREVKEARGPSRHNSGIRLPSCLPPPMQFGRRRRVALNCSADGKMRLLE